MSRISLAVHSATWILAAASLLGTLRSEIVISEFLADNDGFSADEDGDFSDWIEIYNLGNEAINLKGYRLTDDAQEPNQWSLPDRILEPKAFLLIFASGKDRREPNRPFHTNFSLDATGEFLALFAPGNEDVPVSTTGPSLPAQRKNVSYGWALDGTDDVGFLLTPTPSGPNGEITLGFVADTRFSHHRGFHTAPLAVAITTATKGASLHYTTDGSPPTENHGTLYTEPVVIDSTTILQAIAFKPRYQSSNIDTQTYLFPSDVRNQITMDARVTEAPDYREQVEAALGSTLPALSVVTQDQLIFGRDGIYSQYDLQGREAEIPISLEYFAPHDPEDRFHLQAGLRIHGGNARSHPKKPFRLYFREEYSGGSGRLEHSLFAGSPVDSFEQLVLRSGGHDSWSLADRFGGSDFDLPAHGSYLRDQFLRKTENDMGLLSPLGKYVHLYLNGVYWGVYDLHERPNATYFSDHLGGEPGDWDVLHHPDFADENYSVVDGNAEAWEALQGIANGQVADEIGFQRFRDLVDLDAFIDSLIVRMWSGDYDWCGPILRGLQAGNETIYQNVTVFGNKNWYAGRRSRSIEDGKFYFFSWDAEMSMGLHLMFNLLGNTPQRVLDLDLSRANDPGSPAAPYHALIAYPPFRRHFADRVSKHLFNGGALSPEKSQPRLQEFIDQLTLPIIAESARWGNTAPNGRGFTRDDNWLSEVEWLRDTFLVERRDRMLEGFRHHEIFPEPDPPRISRGGGFVEAGQSLTLTATDPEGTLYYTTDGSDPAELPEIKVTQVMQPDAPCVWLAPNASNGAFSSRFRWKLVVGYPNPQFWWNGKIGLGFDRNTGSLRSLFNTDVKSVLTAAGANGIYCRVPFSIPSQLALDRLESLILRLRYDDGFAAYINGAPVASANVPSRITARSAALEPRAQADTLIEEAFDVTSEVHQLLVVGTNLLALHGMNSPDDPKDFLLAPRLELREKVSLGGPSDSARKTAGAIKLPSSGWFKVRILDSSGRWSALTEAFFHVEPVMAPGDLMVSEIHYRPAPPRNETESAVADRRNDFEFIEILNTRDSAIELNGATFTRGIRFTFPQGLLAPGERAVIVRNEAAFNARYASTSASSDPPRILGTFERDSKLSDGGETLTMISKSGEIILEFRYNDKLPWPEAADGEGVSLVYQPFAANPDPNDATQWVASLDPDGYPGRSGLTRFEDWQTRYFTEAETMEAAFDADPDRDGLVNGLEYALGSHPRRPTEPLAFMGFGSLEQDGEEPLPTFQFLRRPGTQGLRFSIAFSSDLRSWEPPVDLEEVADQVILTPNVHDRERVSVPLETPLPTASFGRIEVTLDP